MVRSASVLQDCIDSSYHFINSLFYFEKMLAFDHMRNHAVAYSVFMDIWAVGVSLCIIDPGRYNYHDIDIGFIEANYIEMLRSLNAARLRQRNLQMSTASLRVLNPPMFPLNA